jgi:hypothetical protein
VVIANVEANGQSQRDGVIDDAHRIGARVESVTSALERFDGTDLVTSIDSALFRGAQVTSNAHVFVFETQGFRHCYVQPYDDSDPLPGVHIARIEGTIRQAGIFLGGPIRQPGWYDGGDHSITAFDHDPTLQRLANDLSWQWNVGTREFALPWTVQVRACGGGHSEVVLRAGRYGGLSTYGVGMGVFLQWCSALHQLTGSGPERVDDYIAPIGHCSRLVVPPSLGRSSG